MKELKDNFSGLAKTYAAFRPQTPEALFQFLLKKVSCFETAWDCGTGNGQVAAYLSDYFELVYGTDISEQQLAHAVKKDNVVYKAERSEKSSLADNSVDLITIAQAIHWFDFDSFYGEVKRVAKDRAVIAAWTYVLLSVDKGPIDEVIKHLYTNILGDYWDKERTLVDEMYQTIPFPFEDIPCPVFYNKISWNREQLIGYLNTWSSVGHYVKKEIANPVALVEGELRGLWDENELKEVTFPIHMRAGFCK